MRASKYPKAVAPDKVGQYPALAKSGGGYFYDDVLEYRVWHHPKHGSDLFRAFGSYEDAVRFAECTPDAEEPLVLVRQREWVSESTPGQFAHERSVRIAEWSVEWLEKGKRSDGSIELFLRTNRDA